MVLYVLYICERNVSTDCTCILINQYWCDNSRNAILWACRLPQSVRIYLILANRWYLVAVGHCWRTTDPSLSSPFLRCPLRSSSVPRCCGRFLMSVAVHRTDRNITTVPGAFYHTIVTRDVGLRLEKLVLRTRIPAKWQKKDVLTGHYGKSRGRLRGIPARIETRIQCADLFVFFFRNFSWFCSINSGCMLIMNLPKLAIYTLWLADWLRVCLIRGAINLESFQATASRSRSDKPRVLPSTAPEPGEST